MDRSKALPDELWLLVLVQLPLGALLEARKVCRRLRRLTLDRSVWGHRALACQSRFRKERDVLHALRVAPCLRSLSLTYNSAPAILEAATKAETALAELSLDFATHSRFEHEVRSNVKMKRVLRRQVELESGSLRKVRVSGCASTVAMVELAVRARLDELEVTCSNKWQRSTTVLSTEAAVGNASLKTLRVSGEMAARLVLKPLLRAHASTLQCVSVLCEWPGSDVELLARCPLLHRLELLISNYNAKVLAAAGSARITELSLQGELWGCYWVAFVAPVPSFAHLRRLSLPSGPVSLRAVAGLKSSAILEYLCFGDGPRVNWSGLLAALRGLPRLRSLSVSKIDNGTDQPGPSEAVVLPSLRQLRVKEPCWHASMTRWCCLPFLHSLVRVNPQMHVLGLPSEHDCEFLEPPLPPCACCEHGLHPRGYNTSWHYSLCGHVV